MNSIDPIPAYAGMTGDSMPEHRRTRMPTAFGGGCRALHDGGGGCNNHPVPADTPPMEGNLVRFVAG